MHELNTLKISKFSLNNIIYVKKKNIPIARINITIDAYCKFLSYILGLLFFVDYDNYVNIYHLQKINNIFVLFYLLLFPGEQCNLIATRFSL